jgi:transcriptional/translational regulatory protein YebC/TACO1
MADAGSVSWQFNRAAYFSFPLDAHDTDQIFELAVEAGADDVTFDDDTVEIIGPLDAFKSISIRLSDFGIKPDEAGVRLLPTNEIELETGSTLQVLRAIEDLEELDDVQDVYSNLFISDEVMSHLEED